MAAYLESSERFAAWARAQRASPPCQVTRHHIREWLERTVLSGCRRRPPSATTPAIAVDQVAPGRGGDPRRPDRRHPTAVRPRAADRGADGPRRCGGVLKACAGTTSPTVGTPP